MGLHLVLVAPEIHWNTGNVGRTALAVGARLHLVDPLGFSLDDKALRRAGLDYWSRVPLSRWPSWEALRAALPAPPWLLSARATRSMWDARFDAEAETVLVFGCESRGLPEALLAAAGERVLGIPMGADAPRSLNLSTAVAVVAYEVLRQQRGR